MHTENPAQQAAAQSATGGEGEATMDLFSTSAFT